MSRIDRYVVREVLGPLGLGFLVYTFIMLIRFLFQSAEMIIRRGLPVSIVGKMLALSLPNIVVLTIPMALLFGILIAVGRLAADSELTALRSCGVSLMRLYRGILLISAVLAAVNAVLMVYALPQGNHGLQKLRLDIITRTVAKQVQPRVFYEEWEGLVLYVFESPPQEERWRGVFLAEALPGVENQITVADWGRVRVDDTGDKVILELWDAYTHTANLGAPDRYDITYHERLERVLDDRFVTSQREKVSVSKGLRELTLDELRDRARDPEASPEVRRLARVEIHKKASIPAACLVFGLLALPLGFNNRRGGRGSGFALSIGVILVYYVLLSHGEEAAHYGKMSPWLAMWLPNLLLAATGLVFLARRNRDQPLLPGWLDRFLRRTVWGWLRRGRRRFARRRPGVQPGNPAEPGGRPQVVLQFPRLRLRFPNILDRYLVRLFLFVFVLVILSGVSLYVVADLSSTIDEILKNDVPRRVVVNYYKYLSIQIFYEISPILVLVTTLITFSLLSRTNEITAFKSLGISLYRLSLPALATAALVTLFTAYLEAEVLPASNQRVAQLADRIRGRESARTYRRADRQWLFGHGRYVYNYIHFDPGAPPGAGSPPQPAALHRLQVFEFGDDYRLARRFFTSQARYQPEQDAWTFSDGWVRSFAGSTERRFQRFTEPILVDYPEKPEYFESEIRPPEQMSYPELRRYIREIKESGQSVPDLEVALHHKLAFPALSLVMALVALPFAFRLGRQGTLYGIGLSVVLGMVYYGVFAFFSTLGEAGALPPAVAVWSPSVVFALGSVYLFLGVRT
jgi:LPS export ABC transporter permease LptF/LPS export ABC transporter permease LptG